MSVRVMSRVWEAGPSDSGACFVLLALADHADDEGRCWPSLETLARRVRMTDRGVRAILRRLEAEGWIEVQIGAGPRGCNLYRVVTDPEARSPRNDVPPGSSFRRTRNDVPCTPEPRSPEPSLNHQEPSEELPCGSSRARAHRRRRPELPLPEEWAPSDRNRADARDRNLSDEEISREAARFRDYHLARGSLYRNWDAAWRGWLDRREQFGPRPVAGGAPPGGCGPRSSLASIVLRRQLARGP